MPVTEKRFALFEAIDGQISRLNPREAYSQERAKSSLQARAGYWERQSFRCEIGEDGMSFDAVADSLLDRVKARVYAERQ